MINLGYADKNFHLRENGIRAGRGMRKKTFRKKGLDYVSELARKNTEDIVKILRWNSENDINFYRITSTFLPWHNKYEIEELPRSNEIIELMRNVGEIAGETNQRITFHPGHFVKLASPDEEVAEKAINEINTHGKILDYMDTERTTYNSINIHIGAHYKDKNKTAKRFCKNYKRLSKSAKKRLTVENDDKKSLWSVSELIEYIHENIDIPVVYDNLHHEFSKKEYSHEEAAISAADTWEEKPIMHYSESRKRHGDRNSRPQNHSDKIKGPIKTYGTNPDVMIEAKKKEKALLDYRRSET